MALTRDDLQAIAELIDSKLSVAMDSKLTSAMDSMKTELTSVMDSKLASAMDSMETKLTSVMDSKLASAMDSMETKLTSTTDSKLSSTMDSIDSKFERITQRLDRLESQGNETFRELMNVEKLVIENQDSIRDLQAKNNTLLLKSDNTSLLLKMIDQQSVEVSHLKGRVERLEHQLA